MEKQLSEKQTAIESLKKELDDYKSEKHDAVDSLKQEFEEYKSNMKQMIKDEVVIVIAAENPEPEFVDAEDDIGIGERAVEAIRAKEREEMVVTNETKKMVMNEVKKLFDEEMSREYQETVDDMVGRMKKQIVQEVTEVMRSSPPATSVLDESMVTKIKDDIKNDVIKETKATAGVLEEDVSKLKNDIITVKDDIIKAVEQKPTYAGILNAENTDRSPVQWKEIVRKQQRADHIKRENNIILYRVQESDSREDAHEHDQRMIQELFTVCEVPVKDYIYRRIGRKSEDKSRPILITFKELDQKISLFRNLKNMKHAPAHIKAISVNHDMTIEQRKETKNLVAMAKEQEQKDPQHRYRLRGPPGDQWIQQLPLEEEVVA